MRFIIFVSVFLMVMAVANYYIYRRFLKKLAPVYSRYSDKPQLTACLELSHYLIK